MSDNREKAKEKAASFCLYLLLCIIVLVVTVVSIGAYWDYKTSRHRREKVLEIIGQRMVDTKNSKELKDIDALKQLRIILKNFKIIAEGMAQNDNMSFLFTVFSIALVSGGAYLLDRSHQNVRMVEGKVDRLKKDAEEIQRETISTKEVAKEVGEYFEKKTTIDDMSMSFLKAEDIGNKLQQTDSVNVFLCNLSEGRQELDNIYRELKYNRLIFDKTLIENFKEKAFGIKANLQSVEQQFQSKVQELVTKCDKIIKLL